MDVKDLGVCSPTRSAKHHHAAGIRMYMLSLFLWHLAKHELDR